MSPSLFTAIALSCFISPFIWWAGLWVWERMHDDDYEQECSDWMPEEKR